MQQAQLFHRSGPEAGVDEAGRGPLAGPVVAAAVILDPRQPIDGLADSKTLRESRREALAEEIRRKALAWSLRAHLAGVLRHLQAVGLLTDRGQDVLEHRAVVALDVSPAYLKVDGNRMPLVEIGGEAVAGEAIVRGDATEPAISAASVLAKTARDRIMIELDGLFPEYGFARHKGYGTAAHLESLRRHGPCEQHRRSFAPVRLAG